MLNVARVQSLTRQIGCDMILRICCFKTNPSFLSIFSTHHIQVDEKTVEHFCCTAFDDAVVVTHLYSQGNRHYDLSFFVYAGLETTSCSSKLAVIGFIDLYILRRQVFLFC